ncbi:hypothetical protein FY036_10155 [Mesorhizobium microcysteis]|uniref:Uncharacterized protein n=1 Tax=Neoaquamicrobium microcysteis TaxID=2682781 RepID=A0A5D4GYA5_9HYPH|nr:hypothetical protein [Mesorhizobium microcysteis]TYR32849.1 hypothetical protein FY036_10155 [Mesorhizobium microcysteis]
MTVKKVSVAPEYVSFYIAGVDDIRVPLDHDGRGIVASDQCINVGCLYGHDGDTMITLGPFEELTAQAKLPKFDGMLDTPGCRVILSDANMPEILSMDVPGVRTRVRIWTNHPTEPDDVVIALG